MSDASSRVTAIDVLSFALLHDVSRPPFNILVSCSQHWRSLTFFVAITEDFIFLGAKNFFDPFRSRPFSLLGKVCRGKEKRVNEKRKRGNETSEKKMCEFSTSDVKHPGPKQHLPP